MANLSVFDWNKTPASNTDVNNVGISGGDNVSSGDDAFRSILALVSQYNRDNAGLGQTIGGTANAITVTINQAWAALADGQLLAIKNTVGPNTGATTLAVTNSVAASLGTKAIRLNGDTALAGGEMLVNGIYLLRYVSSYNSAAGAWCLLNSSTGPTTFADNVFRILGSSDAAKKLAFALGGLTTATTRTATPPDADFTIAALNIEAQSLTGGANVTVKDLGPLSAAPSNTITPVPGARPKQKITNDHAGSILPGSTAGDYMLEIINTTGAGAITTTGWTLKGDSFDTTTTSKFLCSCHVSADQKVMIITKTA